jgi:hypothetical protein
MTKSGVDRETGGQDQDKATCTIRVFQESDLIAGIQTKTKMKREHPGDHAGTELVYFAIPRHPLASQD